MVIYDGFDFGFGSAKAKTKASPRQLPTLQIQVRQHQGDDTEPGSPTSSISGSEAATPDALSRGAEWGPNDAIMMAPLTPRHHPEATDSFDYFMKRGDWKRRGIVFTSEVPMAGEDECFDLEMDF